MKCILTSYIKSNIININKGGDASMDSDTEIYNVWARQICKIKPLINRKVINQLQSFDVKMDNISAFKEIGRILQKANLNNGMISVKEERMINDKLEEIKNGEAINEKELEKIKDEKEKEKLRKEMGKLCYIHSIITLFDNQLPEYKISHSNWHNHNFGADNTIIEPLNSEYEDQKIKIYPHVRSKLPNTSKQNMMLSNINMFLQKHILLFNEDEEDYKVVFHYLGDFFEGEMIDDKLSIAVSPICDYAEFEYECKQDDIVNTIKFYGISNKEDVRERCVNTLAAAINSGAHIIVFPELMGMPELEDDFRKVLIEAESDVLVFLPSYMKDGYNRGIIMYGVGERDIIIQNKLYPFHLKQDNYDYMEGIEVGKELHIIMIERVGSIAEAICVDYLMNDVRNMLCKLRTDIVVNPSFSPGYNYFYEVYSSNVINNLNSIWINTCSVFKPGLFERYYNTNEISMLSMCNKKSNRNLDKVYTRDEKCECSDKKACLFMYTIKV